MIRATVFQLSLVVILLELAASVQGLRINITQFKNCDLDANENNEHFVAFENITYECDSDHFCDTIHATYTIPTSLSSDKLMNITMLRCKADTVGTCNENAESFFERLHCERFRKDETGPWFMFANAMVEGTHCGDVKGVFDLKNAQLKPEYLTNYMKHDYEYPRHRMIKIIHKPVDNSDEVRLRTCSDLEFTIVF